MKADTAWSRTAWAAIDPLFRAIVAHPFILGLVDGGLARDRFLFYLRQDALYLDDFGRVLAGMAVKSPDHAELLLRFAGETIAVERELHRSFLGEADRQAEASPACLLYTSFMHRQLALAPLEVVAAAVLPCFWIYQRVGDFILAQKQRPDNPYQAWIATYGGEDYARSVAQAVAMTDALAADSTPALRQEMIRVFTLCSRMEWLFWDSAWRLEAWPPE